MDLTQPWGWRRRLVAFPGQTDAAWLCRADSCRFAGLGCEALRVLHDALMPETPRQEGGSQMSGFTF